MTSKVSGSLHSGFPDLGIRSETHTLQSAEIQPVNGIIRFLTVKEPTGEVLAMKGRKEANE